MTTIEICLNEKVTNFDLTTIAVFSTFIKWYVNLGISLLSAGFRGRNSTCNFDIMARTAALTELEYLVTGRFNYMANYLKRIQREL